MSLRQEIKAYTREDKILVGSGAAETKYFSRSCIEYDSSIHDYLVTFDFSRGWNCTCVHGSMWGVNKKDTELCWHIESVQKRIQREGEMVW